MNESELIISTDKELLDVAFIYRILQNSYWAKGRTKNQIEQSIENSLCFGLYLGKKQIGFTRILTDYAVFGYVMDVIIDPKFQSLGYGKKLLEHIFSVTELQAVPYWALKTKDAHKLYRKFGFKNIDDPQMFMSKKH